MTAERQRRYMAKLKARANASVSDAAVKAELERTKAELVAVKAELERTQQRLATQARPQASADADREIRSLKTRNQNLRLELHQMKKYHEDETRRRGGMTFATASAIAKALQPDA